MIIPDANLILHAHDSDSPFHHKAVRWWSEVLSNQEPVGLCPAVAFAFLRLSTHGKVFERPFSVAESRAHIASWLERPNVRLLVAGPCHIGSVGELLGKAGTGGHLVTDAQIAALALEFKATVHTADTDFSRFPEVRWKNPLIGV